MIIRIYVQLLISLGIVSILCTNPVSLWLLTITSRILILIILSNFMSGLFLIILFLIYVGGLIIIFSYFLAIQPNIYLNLIFIIRCISINFIFIITHLFKYKLRRIYVFSQYVGYILLNINFCSVELIGVILLLVLIVVVIISTINKAPIRPFI